MLIFSIIYIFESIWCFGWCLCNFAASLRAIKPNMMHITFSQIWYGYCCFCCVLANCIYKFSTRKIHVLFKLPANHVTFSLDISILLRFAGSLKRTCISSSVDLRELIFAFLCNLLIRFAMNLLLLMPEGSAILLALKARFSVFTHTCSNNYKIYRIICYRQPQAAQQTLKKSFGMALFQAFHALLVSFTSFKKWCIISNTSDNKRLPFEWRFGNFGENSNGTVHPSRKFSKKREYLWRYFLLLVLPEFPEISVPFVHTY